MKSELTSCGSNFLFSLVNFLVVSEVETMLPPAYREGTVSLQVCVYHVPSWQVEATTGRLHSLSALKTRL